MAEYFKDELKNFKQNSKKLRQDLLNYFRGIEFGPSTLYDPSQWGSMVHYWPLNGNTDDTVGDINLQTDTTIDGFTIPPASYTQGIDGEVLSSLASESYENIDLTTLPTETVTVATWFEYSSINDHIGSFLANDAEADENVIWLGILSLGNISFSCNFRTENDTSSNGFSTVAISQSNLDPTNFTDTPVLLTMSYDSISGDVTITAKVDSNTHSTTYNVDNGFAFGGSIGGPIDWTNADFILGNVNSNSDHTYTDETMIFDRVLTDQEIDTLYQAGA